MAEGTGTQGGGVRGPDPGALGPWGRVLEVGIHNNGDRVTGVQQGSEQVREACTAAGQEGSTK